MTTLHPCAFQTLDLLGLHQMEHDDKGKVKISDKVENLFSLMDFAQDGKICEAEFLRTTKHYRDGCPLSLINAATS